MVWTQYSTCLSRQTTNRHLAAIDIQSSLLIIRPFGTQHMNRVILGTAGHIDHGKTELVRALTGIETDRLKEEKQRGISIELGFAFLDLGDDARIGIVDVPGHEKFVRQMVAGSGGIDIAALV